jgi:hypothetical protein
LLFRADIPIISNRAALKTHPDRVATDSPERAERTRKFQLVNDAYFTLSDPTRRRDYDAQRRLYKSSSTPADPFAEADDFSDFDEEIPAQGPGTGQSAYSWAWNYFTNKSGDAGAPPPPDRERTQNAQFSDVFEEMMREEGMAEDGTNQPTGKFWGMIGGLSGGALGFIMANVPGMVAGAVAGNRLGSVRDAKGKSVYSVFQVRLIWMLFMRSITDSFCRISLLLTERDCSASWPPKCSAPRSAAEVPEVVHLNRGARVFSSLPEEFRSFC